MTQIDESALLVEGCFTSEGISESPLFLSASGYMTEVQLNKGAGEDYHTNYIANDGVGKFSMNDDLYVMRLADVVLADSDVAAFDEVGNMGAAPR